LQQQVTILYLLILMSNILLSLCVGIAMVCCIVAGQASPLLHQPWSCSSRYVEFLSLYVGIIDVTEVLPSDACAQQVGQPLKSTSGVEHVSPLWQSRINMLEETAHVRLF
jgi:hypothetical protein